MLDVFMSNTVDKQRDAAVFELNIADHCPQGGSCSPVVSDDDATAAGASDVVLVPNTRTASTQCVPLDAGHVSVFTISSTGKTPKTWSPSSAAAGTLLQAILILTIEIRKKTARHKRGCYSIVLYRAHT